MSQFQPQVFQPVSSAQFEVLTAKARAAGLPIAGYSGVASRFGVEISWNYIPEAQQLTLHCLRAPFFVSADEVNTQIQSLVQQTLS